MKVSPEYILESLDPSERTLRLKHVNSVHDSLTGNVPPVTIDIFTPREMLLTVELRSSRSEAQSLPQDVDRHLEYPLSEGHNSIEVEFDFGYDSPHHAFICIGYNANTKPNYQTI